MKVLTCLLANENSAAQYCSECLDEADQIRLNHSPQLAQRTDWQVSRFLKQKARGKVLSLSHSKGRAAILCGLSPIVCGVDIEIMKQRDFTAIAQWVCSPAECDFLARNAWQVQAFYRLWCIKEALIKAAKLDFPADMAQVGYCFRDDDPIGLQVQGQQNCCGFSALYSENYAFAAVWQDKDVDFQTQICGSNTDKISEIIFFDWTEF